MTKTEIVSWLSYWKNAMMVDIDEIHTIDDIPTAMRFCRVMRNQFACTSDDKIWDAIAAMRG